MAAPKRLIERVTQPFAGAVVDRAKGIIRNVKLCGGSSVNGRDYPPAVFRRDYRKYEQAPIYADHERDRSVDRKLGWIENARVDPDGTPRGDAHLLKTHPLYERVMEAAERNPSLFGFSHVAMCHTSMKGSREQVEGLETVESVDLVAEPATTKGLFEARNEKGNRVAFTVKMLEKWLVVHPKSTTAQILKVKKLNEEDSGMYAGADMAGTPETGPDASVEPEDAISAGFEAALMSVVKKALAGDMDPKAALGKIKTLLAAHGDATGDEGADDEGGGNEPPASEGKTKNENAIVEALDICDKLKFRADRTDLQIVASTPKEAREAVAKRLQERSEDKGGERPTAASRHQTAAAESKRNKESKDAPPPSDGKEFAKWVEE